MDDVERIEVVRGPNGAAYGVNAFQGVVNIITRAPSTESGRALVFRTGKTASAITVRGERFGRRRYLTGARRRRDAS